MKIKTGLYIAAAFCLLAFSATSCSDDDEVSVEPLTEESVRGDYAGSILAGTGEAADAALSVGDDIIIADFPVDSIVKLAVPAAAYDEAMASVPAGAAKPEQSPSPVRRLLRPFPGAHWPSMRRQL